MSKRVNEAAMMRHTRGSDRSTAAWRARSTRVFGGCQMGWVEAPYLSLAAARGIAVAELCPTLERIVLAAWVGELREEERATVARQVKAGVLDGCAELTRDMLTVAGESILDSMFSPPSDWEPPVSANEPAWSLHQLRAYRWAAALLARSVRDALQLFRALDTCADSMPALDRNILNTTYACLLRIPELGWRLSSLPRAYVEMWALEGEQASLPRFVG